MVERDEPVPVLVKLDGREDFVKAMLLRVLDFTVEVLVNLVVIVVVVVFSFSVVLLMVGRDEIEEDLMEDEIRLLLWDKILEDDIAELVVVFL